MSQYDPQSSLNNTATTNVTSDLVSLMSQGQGLDWSPNFRQGNGHIQSDEFVKCNDKI